MPRPPQDLETALAPVADLWARLKRATTRAVVATAVREELLRVAGVTDRARADQVLAVRLARRLGQQGAARSVNDPVGWLLARGLARRPGCGDPRCDEGARLDTGEPCAICRFLAGDRRALRRYTAAQVAAERPWATAVEQRAACERRFQAIAAWNVTRSALARERAEARRAAGRASLATTAQVRGAQVPPGNAPAARQATAGNTEPLGFVAHDTYAVGAATARAALRAARAGMGS
ncbi:hypothetical protein [Streptomyces abikoensis]|uniref:hypothetical protein n=1 Tax=Streptomyces abikoensis TaxID=97398 RepID=UPI00167A73DE|nr:hypothetical protein [Streptomyces abikoensis]GGP76087.1 hypothetical protein GCM10010214_59390 [Streptomyces abikoensis]